MHIDYCVRAGVCWMKSSMSSATYRRLKSVTIGNVGLNSLERGHEQWQFQSLQESFRPLDAASLCFQPCRQAWYFSTQSDVLGANGQSRGIQEYPLTYYSAPPVPAILLAPANRADGSSQPRHPDIGLWSEDVQEECFVSGNAADHCYLSGSHA